MWPRLHGDLERAAVLVFGEHDAGVPIVQQARVTSTHPEAGRAEGSHDPPGDRV